MKTPLTKFCKRCGRYLPFEDFYFSKSKMQYTSYCKECHNKLGRQYYARDKNRTAIATCQHFTADEIKYIEANYQVLTAVEIAQHLHRSAPSVRRKAFKLGLHKYQSYKGNRKR